MNHSLLRIAPVLALKIVGTGLGFLFSIMLARILGANGAGVYFIALAIVSIGATVARLGLDNAVLRFASVAYAKSDRAVLASLLRQSIVLVVVVGGIVTSLIWFVSSNLPLGGGEKSGELHAVLFIMSFATIPVAIVVLQGQFFKAIDESTIGTIVSGTGLRFLLVVGLSFLFLRGDSTTYDVGCLYVIATISLLLMSNVIWSRREPGLWQEPGHFDTRLLLRTSIPLLLITSMTLIMNWTDILVLGAWEGSAVVGVYGVATRIAALAGIVLIAASTVIAPQFATLFEGGNHEALERLAQQSARWMLLLVLPLILILLLFPAWILLLFGSDFTEGAAPLRLLALGQLVNVAMGSVGYLLVMTGHEKVVRNLTILSAILNLIGNLVLVPIFGAVGAAASTAFSMAFLNIASFWSVRSRLRINILRFTPEAKP